MLGTPDLLPQRVRDHLRGRTRSLIDVDSHLRTAVLVPLLQDEQGNWRVLFEVRSRNLKRQPGEVCFPGGYVEPSDPGPQEAAVRETCEELQIPPGSLEVLGELDVLITPWRLMVYPYVGHLRQPALVRPSPEEIEEVFAVRVGELLTAEPERYEIDVWVQPREDFPFEKIPGQRAYRWRRGTYPELFYEFDGHVVWGLTARILRHFVEVIRKTEGEG